MFGAPKHKHLTHAMKTHRLVSLSISLCTLAALALPAFAARPVARWDVIPDQRFEGTFEAGVVAFHRDGAKVEFSVNGKPLATAAAPALNPRTKVWEYFVPLKASDYPDGEITVQARAVSLSTASEAYDLPELILFANSRKTLSVATQIWADAVNGDDTAAGTESAPKKTLAAAVKACPAGGVVNLKAGTYSAQSLGGGKREYWTTIQAAPGATREQVEIEGGRPSTNRLRFKNVMLFIDHEGRYAPVLTGDQGKNKVWVDNCVIYNKKGRWAADTVPFGNVYPAYITGGILREMNNGTGGVILRGLRIEKIGSDAWTGGGKLVVNCETDDINPGSTGAHPDFHQSHANPPNWVEDVILYNVRGYRCHCQGLFGARLRNSAFVNVEFQKESGYYYSQYSGPMENVLFLHNTIISQSWLWRDSYAPVDVVFMNNLVVNMAATSGADTDPSRLHVSNNHFTDAKKTFGLAHSSGDPRFVNPAKDDYRIPSQSPAAKGAVYLQCVPADIDGIPHAPAASAPRAKGAHAVQDTKRQSISVK